MRIFILLQTIFSCIFLHGLTAQEVIRNLDFEQITPNGHPISWSATNMEKKYMMYVDTAVSYSGKCSFYIGADDSVLDRGTGVLASLLFAPNIHSKQKVQIRAYIKTQDLQSGEATIGLYLNDKQGRTIKEITSFEQNTLGTADWTKHTVELPISPDVGFIGFAFHMSGSGKAWVDGFEVLFDGIPVNEKRLLP